jgi:3',5'-cyclic AMP phosphodiesterase CpdA
MSDFAAARRDCSRREFLNCAWTGLGTLVLAPACLLGAESKREPLKFCVVTDTHLGYKDQTAAERQWRTTAAELAKAEGEFVVHLGDVVDGGREEQYPVYLDIRKTIGKPVHEIPGNHDPQELFEKHIRKAVDTVVDQRWLRLLLLNNSRRDSHDGFLSVAQLEWIDQKCREATERDLLVVLCLHVPVHDNRHPDRGWHVKPANGQKEFYEIVRRHESRILALFHGHFHNGLRGWDDHTPIHEVCFPSALYNQDRKLEEQKAPGYNPLEFRPGFTQVEIANQTMTLRYKPAGVETPAVSRPLSVVS